MGLREDLNAGLAAISKAEKRFELDEEGRYTIELPMPASLVKLEKGRLPIQVALARTEDYFTLATPLAFIYGTLSSDLLTMLLQRQLQAQQCEGISFALNADGEGLYLVYHWMLEEISAEQFKTLFQRFVSSTLSFVDEVNGWAHKHKALQPVHEGYAD